MPPRHTYWTILFGNQPTAFRAAEQDELLPTFKQIQAKHPDAVMMWFARGRLWKSPEEARDTFDRPRYDRPQRDSPKPQGDRPRGPKPEWQNRGPKPEWQSRDGRPQGDRLRGPRPEWKDRPRGDRPPGPPPASPKSRRDEGGKPRSGGGGGWQNRDDRPQGDRPRGPRPEWKDRPQGDRPKPPAFARWPNKTGYGEASPKSRRDEGGKPGGGEGGAWRDKPHGGNAPWQNRHDRPQGDRPRGPRPEWKDRPQGDKPNPPASARWPNKAGYGGASPPASPKARREGGKPRSGGGGAWQNRHDRPQGDRPRGPRPEWKDRPQGDRPPRPQSDVPPGDRPANKAPDLRGRDWRPGGVHKDPRDRFKVPRDVKRARFKHNLQRANPRPPRKKKDEE
jgi:23S rRNA pseudouridine2605 synthase